MTDTISVAAEPAMPPLPGREPAGRGPVWSPPGRLYMTGDLRAASGLSRTHLDYYLREGLIVPTTRSESGYLLFDDAELATLRAIVDDRAAGLPLREIRRRLGR
jgi:hypothetical protein